MNDNLKTFASTAKDLARNPLGIIALFILLVYGFACLVLGITGKTLDAGERLPLVWFLVVFPVVVLCAFYRLVAKHHRKLYAPSDYQDEANFLREQGESLVARQPTTAAAPEDVEALMKVGEGSVVVHRNETSIKQDLTTRKLNTDSESERILVRHLAIAQAGLWFERTYYMIFGSQIRLLKHLNETKKPVDMDFVDKFFSGLQQNFPQAFSSWTSEQYLAFMLISSLMEKTEAGIGITPEGSEFLIEMTRRGLAEGKGL
jgi:hypothetical protein